MSSLVKRSLATVAVAGGALVISATTASAHVTLTPSTTAAGAYSVLTFGVPHGCDGSATTKVAIQIPNDLASVTPTVNPGWTVEKVMEKLTEPVSDGHGGQYTERVSEVVYTAKTPLPDGYRDTLAVQVKLPDEAGKTLYFPAVQTCEKGETAWVQLPAAGDSDHELEAPAPGVTITAAAADGHGATPVADAQPIAAVTDADAASTSPVAWVGVGLGAAGLALGGVALARSRRTA